MRPSEIVERMLERSPASNVRRAKAKLSREPVLTSFDNAHPAVFFLSTGRAGSQTMQALLAIPGTLMSLHEPLPSLSGLSKLAYEHTTRENERRILREAWESCRRDLLQTALRYRKGYVETGPPGTFLAPVIREAILSAKFIHLIRNPMDVVRSGMRRRWYNGHPGDPTRIVPRPDSTDSITWENYSPLEKNIWLWKETNNWIFDFCSQLPEKDVLRLKAEEIFGGDPQAIEQLFRFVHAPIPRKAALDRVLNAKLNAQKTGTFSEKEKWNSQMKAALDRIAGPTIARAGYSSD